MFDPNMRSTRKLTITLPAGYWRAIMDLVRLARQQRGGKWVEWGLEVEQTIRAGIYGGTPSPVGRPEDTPAHRKLYTEDDDVYHQEPDRPYTSRDLQNDLGMDALSSDEFDSWLDDQG